MGKTIRYAIEDSFPIVEINRMAIPERNAFKPIYHKSMKFGTLLTPVK